MESVHGKLDRINKSFEGRLNMPCILFIFCDSHPSINKFIDYFCFLDLSSVTERSQRLGRKYGTFFLLLML